MSDEIDGVMADLDAFSGTFPHDASDFGVVRGRICFVPLAFEMQMVGYG